MAQTAFVVVPGAVTLLIVAGLVGLLALAIVMERHMAATRRLAGATLEAVREVVDGVADDDDLVSQASRKAAREFLEELRETGSKP